jgi:hypothetical protein
LYTYIYNIIFVAANDPVIYGPGTLGFLLSVAQMILYIIYGVSKSNNKAKEEELGQGGSLPSLDGIRV